MRPLLQSVCLIIPCHNEASRLDLGFLDDLPAGAHCLFVDDGSTDQTAALIKQALRPGAGLLVLKQNAGKAEAVRRGILHARANGLLAGVEWVGFWDADMATPLAELPEFLKYASTFDRRVHGILGSRVHKLGSTIRRSYRRHLAGRAFATLASGLLGIQAYDSQCGAKLFRVELVDAAFGDRFFSRWIFDVEILLRLHSHYLIEYPLRSWTDVPGGSAKILPLLVPTLRDLFFIRRHYSRRAGGDAV